MPFILSGILAKGQRYYLVTFLISFSDYFLKTCSVLAVNTLFLSYLHFNSYFFLKLRSFPFPASEL